MIVNNYISKYYYNVIIDSTRQLENFEVHKKSEMTTLSKKERDTCTNVHVIDQEL